MMNRGGVIAAIVLAIFFTVIGALLKIWVWEAILGVTA